MRKGILACVFGLVFIFTGCGIFGATGSDGSGGSNVNGGTPNSETHKDSDGNGVCDDCGESVTVTLDFFGLNDLHGKFADSETQPGVDELSTYLKQAKAANENTLLLASGDMWQGSSESNLTKGRILTDWMNEMDFASMTLGNHEYDWGESYIEENANAAEFPFLAINVYERASDERAEYCQPSVTVEMGGAQIGIIGAIGDCYSSISSDKVQDIYFKTGEELTELVKAESRKLREEGADFIVYSLHDGYSRSYSSTTNISDNQLTYYDIELSEGYVDLVFEGHTHQRYVLRDSKGIYHLQNGGDNDGISHAEVTVNYANDVFTVNEAEFISTSAYDSLADDPIVETLLDKYEDEIALAGKVLGQNDRLRTGDELRQLVADLYYEAGVEKWGSQYEIVLGGGFISVRSPYNLAAGQVIYSDLQSIFPFDNELVLCSVSGRDLKNKFFETTNSNYFIGYGEYGASVKENINLNATYYIVTDTYSSSYAPNRLTEIERYDTTTFARDLLAKYVEEGGLTQGEKPITLTSIPAIYELGNALADNEETRTQYFVKGKIISIASTTWGNMTIEDEDGNTLYIFGVYDKTGSVRYDALSAPPQVGDVVVLEGTIKKYVTASINMIELVNGKIHSVA